jgi:hypothetical protein
VKDETTPSAIPRAIVGYHQDEFLDWVGELECGYGQHLRHNPPWVMRAWVTTSEGRQAHLGRVLQCRECVRVANAPRHP